MSAPGAVVIGGYVNGLGELRLMPAHSLIRSSLERE